MSGVDENALGVEGSGPATFHAGVRVGDLYPVDRVLYELDRMCHDTIPTLAVQLSPDVDGMVALLQLLRRAQAQLRWADEALEDEIVKAMPRKDLDVAGVGRVEMHTTTARKQWDKAGLVAVLTARIADDPRIFCDTDTGELLTPTQTVERVLNAFLGAATPSWKVTGLREFRIDPDDYAEVSYGRKTIRTPKVDPWPDTSTEEPN